MWAVGNSLGPCADSQVLGPRVRSTCLGFTLLELLVVISIIAAACAGVALALRDGSQAALDRDAQRLAVLFESARAQSRATGVAVTWQPSASGFAFTGLAGASPNKAWLSPTTGVVGTDTVRLGPEPMIGAQAVDLYDTAQSAAANPQRLTVRIASDGLRPFSLQTLEQTAAAPVSTP